MMIPMRELIALAGVAVFMAATITVAIVLIVKMLIVKAKEGAYSKGYRDGFNAAHAHFMWR